MSEMSQLHAELSEQAYELGYETLQDALNDGYEADYNERKLVKADPRKLELAQLEWEKEKIDKRIDEIKTELSNELKGE